MANERYIALILSAVLLFSSTATAITGAQVAVYSDAGAWADGITAFEKFLDWKNMTHERVLASDVNTYNLSAYYDAIYFPGGYAYDYKTAITTAGNDHIRELVNNGGAYIGMCAGAYYASDKVEWEGKTYDYPLKLFMGRAYGAIDPIIPWAGYTMTNISLDPSNAINQYEPSKHQTLYYGGPAFYPNAGVTVGTVATWDGYSNARAIINFSYGSGRVLLYGPHPEINEDSDNDGTGFGDSFSDNGSEWSHLWTAMDWAFQQPLSSAPAYPPEPTEIFFDGFESGSFATNNWTTYGSGAAWAPLNTAPYSGTWHARAKKTGAGLDSYLEKSFSTVGYSGVGVKYARKLVGLDAADEFKMQWYDGTTWQTVEETGSNSANDAGYVVKLYALPSGAADNANFRIRFQCTCGAVSEWCDLDDVRILSYS